MSDPGCTTETKETRWLKYLAAGSSAAISLGAAQNVNADVILYNPADITIDADIDSSGQIFFDLDNSGGGILASATDFADADFEFSFKGGDSEKPQLTTRGGGSVSLNPATFVQRHAGYETIDDSLFWSNLLDSPDLENNGAGPWAGFDGRGYVGLRLERPGNQFNYGWARITYSDPNNSLTLHDFAIETTLDQAITTAIPEPGSAALLALGAAGLVAYRQRRKSSRVVDESAGDNESNG